MHRIICAIFTLQFVLLSGTGQINGAHAGGHSGPSVFCLEKWAVSDKEEQDEIRQFLSDNMKCDSVIKNIFGNAFENSERKAKILTKNSNPTFETNNVFGMFFSIDKVLKFDSQERSAGLNDIRYTYIFVSANIFSVETQQVVISAPYMLVYEGEEKTGPAQLVSSIVPAFKEALKSSGNGLSDKIRAYFSGNRSSDALAYVINEEATEQIAINVEGDYYDIDNELKQKLYSFIRSYAHVKLSEYRDMVFLNFPPPGAQIGNTEDAGFFDGKLNEGIRKTVRAVTGLGESVKCREGTKGDEVCLVPPFPKFCVSVGMRGLVRPVEGSSIGAVEFISGLDFKWRAYDRRKKECNFTDSSGGKIGEGTKITSYKTSLDFVERPSDVHFVISAVRTGSLVDAAFVDDLESGKSD